MRVNIDRIEEGIAVLLREDDPRERITVPVSILPPGSREGDVLTLVLETDDAAATAAKGRVATLIEKLKKKG